LGSHKKRPGAPLAGITRAGWKLMFAETPTDFSKDVEAYRKVSDFYYSIGFNLDSTGRIDLKYPKLERIDGTPDRLEAIFRPR
jgi:hypothetical protein